MHLNFRDSKLGAFESLEKGLGWYWTKNKPPSNPLSDARDPWKLATKLFSNDIPIKAV